MNAKKITSIIALALTASLLTACSATQKVIFNRCWNYDTLRFEDIHEVLEYDVSFEEGTSYGYGLNYNGTYRTELQSQTTPEGYRYLYTTELITEVTYTLGEESKAIIDRVTTEVQFYPAENGLQPIYSKKSVVSSSPMTTKPTSIEDCYRTYAYEVTTEYEGKQGKSTLTQNGKTTEHTFTIDDEKASYLDNEQLLLSLRAMPASVNSTQLLAYSPFTASVQKISVGFGNGAEGEFEYSKNGESTKQTIPYRPVQIQINDKNSGFAQTAWIAKAENTTANVYRNVMLRLETPLYQGLGKLIYTLTSADYS